MLPLTGCVPYPYSLAKALPKPEWNCVNRLMGLNHANFRVHGTAHFPTLFGYSFGSLSELHPSHPRGYRNQHFALLANGRQGNWNWKILISRALRYEEGRCSFLNRNSQKYWDKSFFILRSKVVDILGTKTPGLNVHVYLVSWRMQLKIFVRRFSFSSIPLAYYFNAAIHVHKNGHCVMRFPGHPIDTIAHELVHALNDMGLIPRAPTLVAEETRAYLFDHLVLCAYPSPEYPCRPLKFYNGWSPRHDSWLMKIPDQLARVVAAKATQKRFGSPLYLANGSLIYDAYSRWVGKMILNPSALEPIIKATKRQYLRGHKFSLPRQCR